MGKNLIFWLNIVVLSAIFIPAPAYAQIENITLQLKWKHAFQFAGIYMAIEKGYYKEVGLNVTLLEGGVGHDSIQYVLEHKNAYAVADSGALVAYAHGKPIKVLGAIFQYSPLALLVKEDSGIQYFSDLRGKRVMIQDGYQDVDILAALKKGGLSEGDFIRQDMSYNLQDLIDGHTDAFSIYTTDQPHQMKKKGVPYKVLSPKLQGVEFYGDILITSDEEINKHPTRAKNFFNATIRGWKEALKHQHKAIELILSKYNTQHLSLEQLQFEAGATSLLLMNDLIPVGHSDVYRWEKIAQVFAEQGFMPQHYPVKDFMLETDLSIVQVILQNVWQFLAILFGAVIFIALISIVILRKTIRNEKFKLVDSELTYQRMIEASPEPIGIHCLGKWVYVNPAGLDFFGAETPQDILGKSMLDFVHPDDHPVVIERSKKAVKGEAQEALEERLLRLDGTEVWAEVIAISLQYHGQDSGMVLTRDITERKRLEAKNLKNQEKMNALRQTLEDLNKVQDSEGAYKVAIQGVRNVLGCDGASILLFGDDDKVHFVAWDGISANYRRAVDGHSPWAKSDKDASPICLSDIHQADLEPSLQETILEEGIQASAFFPLIMHGGVAGKYMAYYNKPHVFSEEQIKLGEILADDFVATLERLQAASDRETIQRKVEHTQRLESLGVLAGGIAHDFNNILSAIMGNATLANRKVGESPTTVRMHLDRIVQSSEKAALLCQQMLAYSGQGEILSKPIQLSRMVKDIASLLDVSIHTGVDLVCRLQEDLPIIEADEAQVQQIIMNLVINASDAIEDSHGSITLITDTICVDKKHLNEAGLTENIAIGDYVRLQVTDTGCGMDKRIQDKIFEPFFTTKFLGRGLGMSVVLGIMRKHGGSITIDSVVGRGTTFNLLFPVTEKEYVQEDIEAKQAGLESKLSGCVLVVDDDTDVRELAVSLLEEFGFKTLEAVDGEDGVRVYQENLEEIDIVLLDLTMPKLDGAGCFKALKGLNENVKVIISSGYNEQEVTAQFINQGVSNFIQKPYRPEALEEMLQHILN